MYKKGQKVRLIKDVNNASQFNGGKFNILGAYQFNDWAQKTFTIEGTVKLCDFKDNPKTECAYLLSLDGEDIGYVYNEALEEVQDIPNALQKAIDEIGRERILELLR